MLLIDAKEYGNLAIFDVPGAYLQAEMPAEKKTLCFYRDKFMNIVCEVNTEYKKYVTVDRNGTKDSFVKVLHTIYGCIGFA